MQKMRTLTIILTLATLATFTSCDCVQNVTGTVIDEQTEQPIQNAHVQKENKEYDQADTDDKGNFEIMSISGGIFGCPPMAIIVSKEGYESKTLEIDNAQHETIKLQKVE
ncbi:CarboxypepD_reg-like domain-containing protein [Algoriphagus winogradskyi]|uniref:CarboxypepD_reg-like domain-containing protein n=2 Tax=Algoriphagus winogradskyi TaxID=237017 RepID=A0ABY1NB28_9BACT|nr:CarboxypepD_reg-like domain-containing protein [Algoriphagus winogradskyi]